MTKPLACLLLNLEKDISSLKICKIIKKGWKIIIVVFALLVAMLGTGYLALQNSWVQTRITQYIANILSEKLDSKISVGHVKIKFFNQLNLEDLLIEDQGNDTLLFAKTVTATIDTLKFKKQILNIDELKFNGNKLNINRDTANVFNFNFLFQALGKKQEGSVGNWLISCKSFHFKNVDIDYFDYSERYERSVFVDDLNLDVTNFRSQADSVTFNIDEFKMNDGKQLELQNLSAQVTFKPREINIVNCDLRSHYSEINDASLKLQLPYETDSISKPLNLNLRVGNSRLSFIEVGELLPGFEGMDQLVDFSGEIYGNINDLKGRNIIFETGDNSRAILDFYINEPRDPENMYLFVDLKESQTSFTDLSNIRLPNNSGTKYLSFPDGFYEAGVLTFTGNFSGFLTDFVTFGTLKSQMGTLKTDILVAPDKSGTIYYRGNISSENFNLGELFMKDYLGNLTFSGSADGNYNFSDKKISGVFKGDINEINLLDYTYNDITFDGILLDKMFDGLLAIDDPNVKFSFLGQFDFNKAMPDFDFTLNVDHALPGNLNLSDEFPNAEMAFNMRAKFSGDKIDNMDGSIEVRDGYYKNRNGEIALGGIKLQTNQRSQMDSLKFYSDFFELNIEGDYHFRSLLPTLTTIVNRFIPSYPFDTPTATPLNKFNYKVDVKNINPLANILIPEIKADKPFLLYGKIDSEKKEFELEGSIPGIRYGNLIGRDIFIGNKVIGDSYFSKFRFGEIHFANEMNLYNFKIDSRIENDILDNSISWSNYDELTYSGEINTRTVFSKPDTTNYPSIAISGEASKIFIADTLWNITPFNVKIDSSAVFVSGFNMSNNNQVLAINGSIRKDKTDLIRLQMMNFNLSNLDTYLNKELNISGIANGTFGFANLTDNPMFLSDLRISDFTFKDRLMGNVSLLSKWNNERALIDSELKITQKDQTRLRAFGTYQPSTKALDFDVDVDSVSLIVLETFIGNNFSNFQGYGSGSVNIGGTADKILLNGALIGANAGLTIDATQIPYTFSDSVYFKNDTILFDNIRIYDDRNNTGRFNGTIVHSNFNNMIFDLDMTSNKIRALNTTLRDNDKFWGVGVVDGRLDITGRANNILLNGSVTTLQGTDVSISMESESEVEQYDFIQFIKPEEQKEESDFFATNQKEQEGDLNLNLAIEATPEAKIQLIYDATIGDIIKAQGEGILIFQMNEEGEIFLSGNYQPTKGDYLFTLQNVINKRFTIEQGGSIVWSGDPYNAVIDLKAIYKLRASIYDFLKISHPETNPNQRVQVECVIHLEDELANPTIGFEINFPTAEEPVKDLIGQYISTDDELNKQILSLIVLGKFYSPEYTQQGSYQAQNPNMFGTTASELFSNQLSNWLSQINENWDVGVNYRPGNSITDDEIELALSTQIFNDRVTLNGNIGNNPNQYSTNSSQIVGDFEINVKLVPSGKLQFKAYNRSNNNLIYETAPYTQGVGISVTEEFNTTNDLLEKLLKLFTRKKKKVEKD